MGIATMSFAIAAQEAVDDEELMEVDLGGGNYVLVRRPTQGQFARYSLAFGRKTRGSEITPATDEMLRAVVLTEEEIDALPEDTTIDGAPFERDPDKTYVDADWFWDIVADDRRYPDFSTADVMGFILQVVEEFGGFPTKPSSGSTGSRQKPGKSSTASSRRVRSTPSN